MNKTNTLLHLTLIDGIGPSIINQIIEYKPAHTTWGDLYSFSITDFKQLGLSETTAEKIHTGLQNQAVLENELQLIERHQIKVTTIVDESYPILLKQIHLPPPVLYWQGTDLNAISKTIALVGSRNANQYAQQVIDTMVPALIHHQFAVVSGGARGVDGMAHQATIDVGGITIAVLGSGLLKKYPHRNRTLFECILDSNGAIVSSFPLQTDPHPGNFPARNRIISGLSLGTVVVQAAKKSGARITAQYALEQGRDVFAIPGSINDPLTVGCHQLVQEGAKLVIGAEDILVEYGIEHKEKLVETRSKKIVQQSLFKNDSPQATILQACVSARSADDLAVETKLPLSELQALLFDLQLEGQIKQDFTGMWKVV